MRPSNFTDLLDQICFLLPSVFNWASIKAQSGILVTYFWITSVEHTPWVEIRHMHMIARKATR